MSAPNGGMRMALRTTQQGMLLAAIPLLILASTPVAAKQFHRQSILGWWAWNEAGLPLAEFERSRRNKPSFAFNFRSKGVVDTLVYMPHGLGKGAGEGLGSSGDYRLSGHRIVITRDRTGESSRWPSRDGSPPLRYSCKLTMAPDAASFTLKNCPISGVWIRESGWSELQF